LKKIITVFIFCFLCGECFSQAGEWVWIKGDSVPNQPGSYGVQGVPSPTNNPPSLYEPCEWTDLNGNFWLFGGMDYNAFPYADLWKYSAVTNEWTWVKGPGIPLPMPVFGVQGIPSPANNPPGTEYGVASFSDLQGNLWMFEGVPNNLWKYDISANEWTWIKGPGSIADAGMYGIKETPDTSNYPGSRTESVSSWTDTNGDLWLFGGDNGNMFPGGLMNDLWRYHILTDEWTWMKGSNIGGSGGNYGTQGIEDTANDPPARWAYTHWKDASGRLWFFGGGVLYNPNADYFNDLWRYNPGTNSWTWMGGSNVANDTGTYGMLCKADSLNIPGSRFENRASITDADGNFWQFGGALASLPNAFGNLSNDLWKYCVSANQWVWISGDNISNPAGNWGSIGIPNPLNKPNGRAGAVAWTDSNDHLYLFGGHGIGRYNDLWKYMMDTVCNVCPVPNTIAEINLVSELLVFPDPANSSLTISFQSSSKQNMELQIYNTLGKQIYFLKQETTKGKFEKEINVEKLSGGIYFLQVKTKERNMNRKIIISHP
jgi:type IX secretion system substrate protein/galactose oxidase-like protein